MVENFKPPRVDKDTKEALWRIDIESYDCNFKFISRLKLTNQRRLTSLSTLGYKTKTQKVVLKVPSLINYDTFSSN